MRIANSEITTGIVLPTMPISHVLGFTLDKFHEDDFIFKVDNDFYIKNVNPMFRKDLVDLIYNIKSIEGGCKLSRSRYGVKFIEPPIETIKLLRKLGFTMTYEILPNSEELREIWEHPLHRSLDEEISFLA